MQTEHGRYQLADVTRDDDGYIYTDLRARLDYQGLSDDIIHIVSAGETLQSLAATYFQGMPFAAQLWWAIADYQPEPINDPTVLLTEGSVITIPSAAAVQEALYAIVDEEGVDL